MSRSRRRDRPAPRLRRGDDTRLTAERDSEERGRAPDEAGSVVRPAAAPSSVPRIAYAVPGRPLRTDLHPMELRELVTSGDTAGVLWVDIDSESRHQVALLEKVFDFHPLAVEDALNPQSRVKLDEYKNSLFVIVRGVRFCDNTEDPYDIETYNICAFLAKNLVVTVHAGPSVPVDTVFERMVANPDQMERGVERVAHAVMDHTVDEYFPVLDRIDEFVDGLEERVYQRFDQEVMRDVFAVKRLVLAMRRHLMPQREVFSVLTNRPSPFLPVESQVWFRDIFDHVLRINDSLDTYRELLANVMDSYLSQVSNRLGQVTKGLSVIATLSVPFVVVSGMWGMNFEDIPLSHHVHGFWIMLAVQLGLGAFLVWLLRKWSLV
ncbi:MAG: magnesium/cobalt transporter CorA [Gemmatimonadaceae bacterium]|nr:magnesium/cobalt transporter CorA [Gemmatimonadaceae bacterium]